MDLDDISNVSTADLWGRFVAPIRLASERYYPEKIVIIRMSDHSLLENKVNSQNCGLLCPEQTIVIDWSIIEDRQTFSESYKGTDVDELLSQVVDDITEHIYQQYALSTDSNDDVYIDINNVNDLTNYVNAFDFLQNLSSVQSVTLTQVSGEHRRFKLKVLGSKATLMASLKLSKQLILQKDPLAETQADDIPVFYWQN